MMSPFVIGFITGIIWGIGFIFGYQAKRYNWFG
jgi:glucose uptake protein GlcU